jgi:hypothetical protein
MSNSDQKQPRIPEDSTRRQLVMDRKAQIMSLQEKIKSLEVKLNEKDR